MRVRVRSIAAPISGSAAMSKALTAMKTKPTMAMSSPTWVA